MIIATILIFVLIMGVVAIQIVSIQRYNDLMNQRLTIEQDKANEKVFLIGLKNETTANSNRITELKVKNAGSVTVELSAVYIDQIFIFNPENITINPNGNKLNPNMTLAISFKGLDKPAEYNGDALISVLTSRGTKTSAYESVLLEPTTVIGAVQTTFGPLMLNYTEFYHANYNTKTDTIGSWEPGWAVSTHQGPIIWKLNATNIDSRDIELNRNTSLTLMAINSPSNTLPWYLNITGSTLLIKSNQTVTLFFVCPTPEGGIPRSAFSTECTSKVFLVCFGFFRPGNTPYAQTIPFQSLEVYRGN